MVVVPTLSEHAEHRPTGVRQHAGDGAVVPTGTSIRRTSVYTVTFFHVNSLKRTTVYYETTRILRGLSLKKLLWAINNST